MRMCLSLSRCDPGAPQPPTIATFGRGNLFHAASHAQETPSLVFSSPPPPPRFSSSPRIASKTPRACSTGARKGTPAHAISRCVASSVAIGTSRHRHCGAMPSWNRAGSPQDANKSRIECVSSAPSACVMRRGAVSLASSGMVRARFTSAAASDIVRGRATPPRATDVRAVFVDGTKRL